MKRASYTRCMRTNKQVHSLLPKKNIRKQSNIKWIHSLSLFLLVSTCLYSQQENNNPTQSNTDNSKPSENSLSPSPNLPPTNTDSNITETNADMSPSIDKLHQIFQYGTYQEQIILLKEYQSNQYPLTADHLQPIHQLIATEPDQILVIQALVETISILSLHTLYPYLQKVLQQYPILNDTPITHLRLIDSTLQAMSIAYDPSKHPSMDTTPFPKALINVLTIQKQMSKPHIPLLLRCFKGLGILKLKGYRNTLKQYYNKAQDIQDIQDIQVEQIKTEVIKNLALYQKIEDIDFYQNILRSDEEDSYYKWISLIALKQYAPDKKAQTLLIEYATVEDSKMVSRALYALMAFDKEVIRPTFIKAAKQNDNLIRLQAVKCLSVLIGEDIRKMLEYKSLYDPEPAIRKEAKKILAKKISDATKKKTTPTETPKSSPLHPPE